MPRQDMIRARRGTAAEWALSTDILYSGELAWASDTNEFKLGDGFNTFSALPSLSATDAAVAAFVTGGGPTETALNTTFVSVEGAPADGDAIIWDDVAGQWVPAAVEGGGTALTVLSEAEGNTGTATTARAISAARLVQQIAQHAAAGPAGAPGADGADGAPGADGASAYDVAVAEGFVGDETAWLASLVGADGADGATGATGATGPGVAVGGTTGQVLAKASATDYDAEWIDASAGGGFPEPGVTAGDYIPTPIAVIGGYVTPAIANMRMMPVRVRKTQTFDRIGFVAQTSDATTVARVGIYADNGSSRPGALVLDAGTVSLASNGAKTVTINQTLDAGLYWVALVSQVGTTATQYFTFGSNNPDRLFLNTDNFFNYTFSVAECWARGGVTGALPDPAAPTGTEGNNSSIAVFLRGA